ncbi:MAG: phosphate ABC transporter substrate-binding protein PstS [Desulfobacteraceae bacterium]|nr:MAG: phosphate ABC transporter substrate-binding protein PstS [Desulfobacteraceae bacterium]
MMMLVGLVIGFGASVQAGQELAGAGATFPEPFYVKMFDTYFNQTGNKVNYQGIGSGGGIQQLLQQTVDFGGTDAFMTPEEMSKAPNNAAILHFPTCLGAVVVTYNVEGNPNLKLTPDVIADIFLGKITKWNDGRIAALNPDVKLPATAIMVVHRSDGSGTSFVFTEYLSKVSKEWQDKVGTGKAVNWPAGIGGKGNPGVAQLVKQTIGAIGYVELTYAEQNKMPYALIRNRSGEFVKASMQSVSAAANVDMPADTRVSLTDTAAKEGYPIGSFTWVVFYKEQNYKNRDQVRALELIKLFQWMVRDGQKFAPQLLYAPLSAETVKKAEAIIKSATYNGQPLIK